MAESLVTQVSRDGTAATAPQDESGNQKQQDQKKGSGGPLSKILCCLPQKNKQSGQQGGAEGGSGGSGAAAAGGDSGSKADGGGSAGGAVADEEEFDYNGDWLLPPPDDEYRDKKCLVLDLDETLVHSSFKPVANADFVIPVEIEDQVHQVYVCKRPGVDQFLEAMGKLYECVVFTASVAKYANPVMDLLDKKNVCIHRLFREGCTNHKGNYVKDMGRIGRPLKSTIIIDNSPASYMFNPENAVPIDSWFDDEQDSELLDLIPFLEELAKVDDVMQVLDNTRA